MWVIKISLSVYFLKGQYLSARILNSKRVSYYDPENNTILWDNHVLMV